MDTAAYFTPYIPLVLSASTVVVWWLTRFPQAAIVFLFISVFAGQTIRLPLPGQGGGMLLSDIGVVVVLFATGFHHYYYRSRSVVIRRYCLLIAPFVLWSLFTLLIHIPQLSTLEIVIAGSYWIRLSAYLFLAPALAYLVVQPTLQVKTHRWFTWMIAALTCIGFLQLIFIPNLTDLPSFFGNSWDPHMGRLVSTWLDPNFFGAFLGLSSIYCIARKKWILCMLIMLAFILTQSRSSYLAAGLTGSVLLPLVLYRDVLKAPRPLQPHRALLALSILGFIMCIGAFATILLGSRAIGFIQPDVTVRLRFEALSAVWKYLAVPNALLGVGYNTYQFAAARHGLIQAFTAHSRAGTDSSLLTLLVTTGIPGVVAFTLPWMHTIQTAWKKYIAGHSPALAAIASILFLSIHAVATNSFLYAHLLIVLSVIIVLTAHGVRNPVRHT